MNNSLTKSERTFLAIGFATGWFAILVQLYLILQNRSMSVLATVVLFFSFFTILTNIIVALSYTLKLFFQDSKWGKFFSKAQSLTAVAVYIAIVGLVYNIILRHIWEPQGMQKLVDELLHSFNPIWFVLYWLIFVPKKTIQWKHVFPWLLYPLAYCIYILIRGSLTGLYPYPFVNVTELGYPKTLINCAGMCVAFLAVSILFVSVGKIMSRNRN